MAAVVGKEARGERARDLSSRPIQKKEREKREAAEEGRSRQIVDAAAIHDGRPWQAAAARSGWTQTAGQLGSGARYRFALKEDLIEGSKQGWQLNTNSKGLAGWLLVVQHDDDDNAQRESVFPNYCVVVEVPHVVCAYYNTIFFK